MISGLEHAQHTLLFNSGISTISAVLSVLKEGTVIMVQDDFYSGTRHLMGKIFGARLGQHPIKPGTTMDEVREVLKVKDISLIMIESPSNPLLQVYDIKGISEVVREHREGTGSKYPLVVVDNTLATPIFQNPLDLGADIVLHSATKFLAGHSDTLAGSISTNDDGLYEELELARIRMGNHLEDFPAQLLYEGLQTLRLRCCKSMENGVKLAEYLSQHPKLELVLSPLLLSHPQYALMATQTTGFTGMISFYLRSEDFDEICDFAKNLKLFKFGTSLGGIDSLLDHFGGTMRIYYSKEQQKERGYTDNFFRMSVGIEEPDDLIADLAQALAKLK